jgi:signal recognition particle subunit SRP54
VTVGGQAGVPVYEHGTEMNPVEIAKRGIQQAKEEGRDVVIVDTAGRLTVDKDLMDELVRIRNEVKPSDTLLVLDAMTGQDAVNTAQNFQQAIDFDGLILTKLDGDARGGAALSVRAITGVPIKVITTGEKLDQVEEFHADRLASRILGMGDVLSLIEKAEEHLDKDKAAELERKMRKNEFGLDDMLDQLRSIRKMGSLSSVLGMLPGVGKQLKNADVDEGQLDRVEAIILSMTPEERANPKLINGSRRLRIANGSGVTVTEVNALLKQYEQMKKMMKTFAGGKGKMPKLPKGMELPPELQG